MQGALATLRKRMAVVPLDGSMPARRFPYIYTPGEGFAGTFAPGDSLALPARRLRAETVTAFASEQILNYRWSPDGKTLAVSRGTLSNRRGADHERRRSRRRASMAGPATACAGPARGTKCIGGSMQPLAATGAPGRPGREAAPASH
jgi:hypothetical protein